VNEDGPTIDDAIQGLKNQRFWPNPDTLDEDLNVAVFTMEWMQQQLIQHIEGWIQITQVLKEAQERTIDE
jgi:hypothetical protein